DPRIVADSEVDIPDGRGAAAHFAIPPEDLRVFPTDADLPRDELNTRIDEHFVPVEKVEVPRPEAFETRRGEILSQLARLSFGALPDPVPPARWVDEPRVGGVQIVETEPGIKLPVQRIDFREASAEADIARAPRTAILIAGPDRELDLEKWKERFRSSADRLYVLEPRGVGATRFTTKNPPNYVERSHVLLGLTVDTARVRDVIALVRLLGSEGATVTLAGEGHAAGIAIYAALLERSVVELTIERPPATHMDSEAPQLLNVLRVCDLADALGLIAPREALVLSGSRELVRKASAWYEAAGAREAFRAVEE
ncbi:MAG TPA: hypothetical protein VK116_12230, partial [Planctomycetota bacterium]|nr:hypothetical protein [Planctomycetota bacterium]